MNEVGTHITLSVFDEDDILRERPTFVEVVIRAINPDGSIVMVDLSDNQCFTVGNVREVHDA